MGKYKSCSLHDSGKITQSECTDLSESGLRPFGRFPFPLRDGSQHPESEPVSPFGKANRAVGETPSALAILNLAVTGGACVDDALLNHQWTKFFCDVSVWVVFSAPDQR